MPELPEVESVVRSLQPHVAGRRIVAVPHVRADMVRPAAFGLAEILTGQTITTVERRAKRIVFTLGTGDRFYVHLGMTGQLTVDDALKPLANHTHLIADLCDGRQLRLVDPRRFGEIVWLATADHLGLGPEPLTLRPAVLHQRLQRTTRAIKAALLDQQLIAGIGNIYADEALHLAGLHPSRPANSLSAAESAKLNRAIKSVLRRAIRAGGSSIRDYIDAEGRRGGFQAKHRVYDRADEPCRTCRTAIVRIVLGGRSTHFCPACQPEQIQVASGRASRTDQ